MTTEPLRIAVFGAGGVGAYFGGRLARAGHDVVFIARGDHLGAIRARGLQVESVLGDFVVAPAQATDDPGQVGPVDHVLLTVKTWQLPDVLEAIGPMVGPETAVVTLQNGVEAPAEVAAAVGRERTWPGIAKIFAGVTGPGRVRHVGGPASLAFAEWDDTSSDRVQRLRDELVAAQVAVDSPADIWAALWAKFLFVAPLGGVGAVSRAPVGVLRSFPGTRQLIEDGMAEVLAVARAGGVDLADDIVATTMSFVDDQPAAGTSSLQRDIAAGRPSELEAWNGAVVRLGARAGVPTPLNRFLYDALSPLEARARQQVSFAD
jgi:2-dehydropantoate 2-reductase